MEEGKECACLRSTASVSVNTIKWLMNTKRPTQRRTPMNTAQGFGIHRCTIGTDITSNLLEPLQLLAQSLRSKRSSRPRVATVLRSHASGVVYLTVLDHRTVPKSSSTGTQMANKGGYVADL